MLVKAVRSWTILLYFHTHKMDQCLHKICIQFILTLKALTLLVCTCMSYVCVCHGGQKKALNALELDKQVLVSHLIWVLGSKMSPWRSSKVSDHLYSTLILITRNKTNIHSCCFQSYRTELRVWDKYGVRTWRNQRSETSELQWRARGTERYWARVWVYYAEGRNKKKPSTVDCEINSNLKNNPLTTVETD